MGRKKPIAFLLSLLICSLFFTVLKGQQSIVDSLKIELSSAPNDSVLTRVFGDLAYYYSSLNGDSSLHYAQATFVLAEKNNSLRGMINGKYKLAMAYETLGQYEPSIAMARDVISLSKQKQDTFRITLGYNLLGAIQSQSGDYKSAMKHLLESARLSDVTGDQINTAYAYTNIGEILNKSYDSTNAVLYFTKALDLWKVIQDTFELVSGYNNLAVVTKDRIERKKYATKAIELGEIIQYHIGLAYAYRTLGNMQWRSENDLKSAEINYEKSLENAKKGGEVYTLVSNLVDISAIKLANKKSTEAYTYMQEALELSKQYELRDEMQEVESYLAEYHSERGEFEQAYKYMQHAYVVNDTIYNQGLASSISDANAKYELSKKETEIARQDLEIAKRKSNQNKIIFGSILTLLLAIGIFQWYFYRQRKKQNDLLIDFNHKLANAETQALRAQMNPHFIFNALNSIKLYMLNEKPEKGGVYLDAFARLVRSVLQNSKEPLITLEKELEALDLYIQLEKLRFENAFEHEIVISEEIDPSFYEIPPLILQPFVENAIWHGLMPLKNRSGKLKISANLDQEILFLSIEDNGIGREKSSRKNVVDKPYKKSMGVDITKGRMDLQKELTGMGMHMNIIDMVDQKGMGVGTRVEIVVGG